ncbi:MFS transporter [Patescibacteria group bacterium]|nr:MFS transporter [Patescibacteria group bacterium]
MNLFSPNNTGVAGNIWKMTIMYVTNKRTYMTFLSIFFLSIPNATAQIVGFATALSFFLEFVFEVPSGYFADRIGHKNALIIAKASLLISTLCYLLATSIIYFFIASIFFALGLSMLSGTSSSFVKETLDHLGKGEQYSRISGKIRSIGFSIPVIFILLLPILAEESYRLAFLVALVIDVIGLITACYLTPVPEPETIKDFQITKTKNIFHEYSQVGWLPIVIFSSLVFSTLMAGTVDFKNPFQEHIGFSLSMLGVLWGISRIGIAGLLLLNDWFKKHLTLKQLVLIEGFVYAGVLIGVGTLSNKWMIAVLFIIGTMAMWGLGATKSHFYLEYIEESRYKASMLSINTFIEKIITTGLVLVMGYLVTVRSYEYGFLFFGILAFLVTLIGMFLVREKKIR